MAIEVFNRYENKYMLDADTFEAFRRELSQYMTLDAYNQQQKTYTITNLYYDTPGSQLIRTSLQHPKYKEKLRLRAYGVPSADTPVYVEIKKKVAGLVNKRRSALPLNDAYTFLQTGILPEAQPGQNRQVLREVSYILETRPLHPALYLAYDRIAYFGTDQHDLRVSFDHNICTRRHCLALENGSHGTPLLPDEQWLMEIKTAQSIPLWLCRLLSKYEIYPTHFSKYGTEYQQTLEAKTPQNIYVFTPGTSALPRSPLALNA